MMVLKTSIGRATILLLALSGALPALAHGQAAPQQDVVVTAPKALDTRTAQRFVATISSRSQDQLARFVVPVCPVALGFAPTVGQLIVARIRDVAARAGARVAKEGCAGNVTLMATPDSRALIVGLRQQKPQMFGGLQPAEIDRLVSSDGPVRSWTSTETANEDGTPLTTYTLQVRSASMFNPSSQQVIDGAVVLIDAPAVLGKTVTQLADYAAMRVLAKTRPVAGEGEVGTILSLFYPATNAPAAITDADLAYLKALYAAPALRTIHQQIGEIAKGVKQGTAPPAKDR